MGKKQSKSAFLFGMITILWMAFMPNASAQQKSLTFLNQSTTTSQSALLVAFASSIDDGEATSTAISVSNILGVPSGSGFPEGQDESGPLSFYLFNNIGTVYTFHTADHPDIGFGLDLDGNLPPGGTYSVFLHEILQALHPDRVPADRDFTGYAWIVADFDAAAGTYFNSFPLVGVSQSFQMVPVTGGLPVIHDQSQ